MITKFEKFNINVDEPKLNDYVICDEDQIGLNSDKHFRLLELINILKNKIGKIVDIDNSAYIVQYENIPKDMRKEFFVINKKNQLKCRRIFREEIIFWSKSKKELEANIEILRKSKKYNVI